MQALKLLNEGKLDEAIAEAIDFVRNAPTNVGGREILAELFCLSGDLVRADKQAETLLMQQPKAAMSASLLRQLLRAETARRECWHAGRVPEFIGEPGDICQKTLEALVALRTGEAQQAHDLLMQLDDELPTLSGTCNSEAFAGFRDLDDFCVGICEVLTTTGKYFWIPMDRIVSVEFLPVTRPRDLQWRQCKMSVQDGPDGVVYIPALYIDTVVGKPDSEAQAAEQLGRATSWIEKDGEPVRGQGQRLFLVGEQELSIMELAELEFTPAS